MQVFEAALELRNVGAGLVLGANAMRALQALGLHDTVRPYGTAITHTQLFDQHRRLLHTADAAPFTQRLGVENVGIPRAKLQQALLTGLPAGTLALGKALVHFRQTPASVQAHFADGTRATADFLLGADGLRSAVRHQLLPAVGPRYAGYCCWQTLVDATPLGLPAGAAAEIWGAQGRRFGYVPVGDHRFYWFACLNAPQPQAPALLSLRKAELQHAFAAFQSPVPDLLGLADDA